MPFRAGEVKKEIEMAKQKEENFVRLDEQTKVDVITTGTKPELKIRVQGPNLPGSFIIREDGTFEPNLNDEAMRERAEHKDNTE